MDRTPEAQETEARIDKRDCIRLKSFCTAKEKIDRMIHIMGENLCQLFICQRNNIQKNHKVIKFEE
jgi:ubiquinone biosynthesis protein Coq4